MFPDMLSYLRKREKLTQGELAKALGIARSTLASYERGLREPNFEMLEAIADFFNVNMSTLLGEEENTAVREYNEAILMRIRQLCSRRGTSISKIEKALGYDIGTISDWNNAITIVPLEKVVAVAKHLNVPALALTGDLPEEDEKIMPTISDEHKLSPRKQELFDLIDSLPDDKVEAILRLLGVD